MKKDNKKTWKKPELKKLDGTNTKAGSLFAASFEDSFYYKTTS